MTISASPGARFIAAFNEIEDHLRQALNADEHESFGGWSVPTLKRAAAPGSTATPSWHSHHSATPSATDGTTTTGQSPIPSPRS